ADEGPAAELVVVQEKRDLLLPQRSNPLLARHGEDSSNRAGASVTGLSSPFPQPGERKVWASGCAWRRLSPLFTPPSGSAAERSSRAAASRARPRTLVRARSAGGATV